MSGAYLGTFIALTEEDLPREVYPSCPECGCSDTVSRGPSWTCPRCGRYWKKVYRNVNRIMDDGPSCPKCDGPTRSRGPHWLCKEGHYTKKETK